MQTSSYNKVRAFIISKLENIDGVLPKNKIEDEINNAKKLTKDVSKELLNMIFADNDFKDLNEQEWIALKRDLETQFNVEAEIGILIQGTEQQKRDTKWWTDREKLKGENYYWNRYQKYIKKSLPFEVVKTIDVDTDSIMNNLENPQIDEFSRYGMVVGHVQSGKTGNYSALICKAADAGYKFIVVVAGGMNNLRNQTQDRLNHSFVGRDMGTPVGVGKLAGNKKSCMPASLTTKLQDFNKKDANRNSQSINFDNINSPIILVIKKNSSTLLNVIDWLEAQYKQQKISNHAMLLVDDESDYASINTKDEDNPTIINERIRKLLSLFKKSAYVAYTATPYANIFIDHNVDKHIIGKDLFPKDFIYALGAPSNYFGARKIFLETNFKHIVLIKEPNNLKLTHKKDANITYIPESLEEAIRLFIINIGIRNLRNQKDKHNSMLIHASRFTMVHQKITRCVEDYIIKLRKDIVAYGMLNNPELQSKYIAAIKDTFQLRCSDVVITWKAVIRSISTIIETVIIREVHQEKSVELEYRDDYVTNAIVIGGTSLSRGYTLEGLSVTYFLRKTVFYDTLMQMARWFGYRHGYEDLCKIYMTSEMRDNFKLIIEATEELFEDFRIMEREKRTPEDFGLAVQQHPDSGLQVTARNKQKNSKEIYYKMKLDGSLKETRWITADKQINAQNVALIKNTLLEINQQDKRDKEVKKACLWKNVNSSVVKKFVEGFKIYNSVDEESDIFGIKSRMPVNFIKKYIDEIDTEWDIALYSGDSHLEFTINDEITVFKEIRQVEIKDDNYYEVKNRQVSSGTAEAISLSEDECMGLDKNKRKEVRALLKRPLLMLHVLDTEENHELAAFGISFPGSIISEGKTIVLKINTVYIEKLLKGEEYDD